MFIASDWMLNSITYRFLQTTSSGPPTCKTHCHHICLLQSPCEEILAYHLQACILVPILLQVQTMIGGLMDLDLLESSPQSPRTLTHLAWPLHAMWIFLQTLQEQTGLVFGPTPALTDAACFPANTASHPIAIYPSKSSEAVITPSLFRSKNSTCFWRAVMLAKSILLASTCPQLKNHRNRNAVITGGKYEEAAAGARCRPAIAAGYSFFCRLQWCVILRVHVTAGSVPWPGLISSSRKN